MESLLRRRYETPADSRADLFDQIQHAPESEMAISHRERDAAGLREVEAAFRRPGAEAQVGVCRSSPGP